MLIAIVLFGFYWAFVLSIKVVGPDEVVILLFLGKPEGSFHKSGGIFVPWVPFEWNGHPLWELVRIPTKMFEISYKGSEEHKIWSKDNQLLMVETSVYARFPYDDAPALNKMVQSSVPTTKDELKDWMEQEVIRVVRQVMSKRGYKIAIEGSDSDAITDEANKLFERPDGLLVRSGVFGTKVDDKTPGKGEVSLKIEQVLLTEALQKKLELVEAAKLEATAAESVAKKKAVEVGKPIELMMARWIATEAKRHGKSVEKTVELLKKDGTYQRQVLLYKDLLLADEDQLEVTRYEIGAPDGTPISGELPGLAALAAMFGGRGGKNFGGRGGGSIGGSPKFLQDMSPEEKRDYASWRKKNKGGN